MLSAKFSFAVQIVELNIKEWVRQQSFRCHSNDAAWRAGFKRIQQQICHQEDTDMIGSKNCFNTLCESVA